MNQPKRHLVTAALPYANGPLHIGHIAGAYLPSDIYVRYLKARRQDVVFVCGSDEHGAAITMRALKEDITPQEIVDKYHKINKKAFEDFGIDFDIYDRTSTERHAETAQQFFLDLEKKGSFEVETREQFYDEEHKQFLADRYITGECPKCGHSGAYGDQCEKCGSSLNANDLINPKSVLSGKTPVLKETKHWYLPMQRHENWLKDWITEGTLEGKEHHDPKKWRKQVIGQCMSWIDGGLAPRAMTRDLSWGVPVPIEGEEGKVLYVWLDAPIGYITATKHWAAENGSDWEKYWKDDESSITHFIAKDNIVFHCIIFPILLKEHGEYNLPVNVPANEFLNLEGDKISTSREWAVWLHEYLEDFPCKNDELRYVLTSISPEAKDSEFTWKDYQNRVNNELVAILGNFVNRALVLTHKYFDGQIPEADEHHDIDQELHDSISEIPTIIAEKIENHRYREALQEAMKLARHGNKYLADTEPWKVFKTDEDRVKTILFNALQVVAKLGIVLDPFMPQTAEKLRQYTNLAKKDWELTENPELLVSGQPIEKPELLFQKVEDEVIEKQVEKLKAKKAEKEKQEAMEQSEPIEFEDFQKMDLRIVEIIDAEPIPKADKLLKIQISLGSEDRTVVSGIAKHYKPDEIIGQRVLYLANLKPRKIFGVKSQGMLLMAQNDESGVLSTIQPSKDEVKGGDKVS
ncbi:methionine--tRNA ligase [Salibacter sp.]|uniref:methionine--tRNA ligase n=1 Tax=Salibacter sp. TaxID=2010995 RepID=UPI00286FCF7F|nr:methionine--tRNA ligase [Salibacter sp.]MDR9399680.1 methionine--tRNA ligase [Salibacter sp.]MDR9487944.1 methionine--tRNA ligase [Salibacter sp.]